MRNDYARVNQERIEALLNAIQAYKKLPPRQQEAVAPVYRETLERFKDLQHCSAIIHDFLAALG